MTGQEWVEVVVLVVCFFVAALASGTETALTSVGRLRVRFLAEQGSQAAGILQRLRADPNRFLSTVLFTNTLALIVASTATALLSDSLFTRAGVPSEWRLWLTLLVSLVLSVVLLIAAEVTPKTLAITHAERVALAAAGPVDRLAGFLGPILWVVTFISRGITGGRAARAPYLTEEELVSVLMVSEEQGVIEEQEHQMIHGIIEIGDKTVREIMVPRTDIIAVERHADLRDVVKVFKEHRHTRMPVFESDIDHVVGLIHTKDLLLFYTLSSSQKFDMDKLLRPIEATPEQKKVDELLHDMRTKKVHMMIVVDEYGGTAGLVTLEDLLEEIVGEIRDEYDSAEEDQLAILNDHEARVDAGFPLEELNSRLGLAIEESGDYDSVGGYVHSVLGKIATAGDSFKGGRARWTVEKVKGRRIETIRLTADQPWPTDALAASGMAHPSQSNESEGTGKSAVEKETGHLP
jgi:putative hemolysin